MHNGTINECKRFETYYLINVAFRNSVLGCKNPFRFKQRLHTAARICVSSPFNKIFPLMTYEKACKKLYNTWLLISFESAISYGNPINHNVNHICHGISSDICSHIQLINWFTCILTCVISYHNFISIQ